MKRKQTLCVDRDSTSTGTTLEWNKTGELPLTGDSPVLLYLFYAELLYRAVLGSRSGPLNQSARSNISSKEKNGLSSKPEIKKLKSVR